MAKLDHKRMVNKAMAVYRPQIKTFSEEQYDVLNKLAKKSKMDCWFCIKQHIRGKHAGEDYVYDLKNSKPMSLRAGVAQLVSGLTDVDLGYLTDEEVDILEDALISIRCLSYIPHDCFE